MDQVIFEMLHVELIDMIKLYLDMVEIVNMTMTCKHLYYMDSNDMYSRIKRMLSVKHTPKEIFTIIVLNIIESDEIDQQILKFALLNFYQRGRYQYQSVIVDKCRGNVPDKFFHIILDVLEKWDELEEKFGANCPSCFAQICSPSPLSCKMCMKRRYPQSRLTKNNELTNGVCPICDQRALVYIKDLLDNGEIVKTCSKCRQRTMRFPERQAF